jgi:hypothetical protein
MQLKDMTQMRRLVGLVLVVLGFAVPAWGQGAGGPRTLEVTPGTSSIVNVSSRMVNELIVPYTNIKLVKFIREDSTASITRDGTSIYVSTGTEEFIQLIIKNGDTPDVPGFTLTLIPVEDVPPQHIRLNPTGAPFSVGGDQPADRLGSSNYEDMLRELVRDAARNEIPSGYTKDPSWRGSRMQVGTVVGEPMERLVGTSLVVEYFILKNIGATEVELVEPNYKQDGVRAIAFINDVLLAPGQSTRMVWVRDR